MTEFTAVINRFNFKRSQMRPFIYWNIMHCMQMLLQLKKVNINVSRSSGLGAIERLWSTLSSDVCVPHWVAQSTQTYTGRELPCCLSLSRQNDWKTLHMNKSGYNQKNSALIFVIFVPVLAAVVFCVEERQQSNSDTKKKKIRARETTITLIWIYNDSLYLKC